MNKAVVFFSLLLFTLCVRAQDKQIYLADPTIYAENGTYYLYGTGYSSDIGFTAFTSRDLLKWKGPSGALDGRVLIGGQKAFGTAGFWAPQVFKYNNRYFMAYAANEYIAIASAPSPLGPFTQDFVGRLETDRKQIDPFIFFDTDGKIYLFYVRLIHGNRIFVAEMKPDLSGIIPETMTECIHAEDEWENVPHNKYGVTEGPTVIKRDSIYYLFYSANDFRDVNYAIGYATSKSPFGPWKRYEGNPIVSRKLLKVNGTGHGDLFVDNNGALQYVFHVHNSDSVVAPRRTALITIKEKKKHGITVFQPLPKTFHLLNLAD